MRYFGDHVDGLAVQWPSILDALKSLGLPSTDKCIQNLPFFGEDTIDRRRVSMTKKGDRFKIKVNTANDDFFECSEEDWEKIGIDWLRKKAVSSLAERVREEEIRRLEEEYERIEPGQTVYSEKLGFGVRKRQVTNVVIDTARLAPISPLIGKIVVCFLSYTLNEKQIDMIDEFDKVRDHARFDGDLDKFKIYWCPLYVETSYHKIHRIRVECIGKHLLVDVTFFNHPNWRVWFASREPIVFHDPLGHVCDGVSLTFDFDDLQNREKIFGFRRRGTAEYEFYKFPV